MNTRAVTNKVKNEEFTLRAWDYEQDHEQVIDLLSIVFSEELEIKGLAVKNLFDEMKSMAPILRFMGLFNKNYKHVLDGFLIENQEGKIVASVNVGFAFNHWEIAMVATHPDYRRRGLARKLVTKAIEHAKEHGAKMCVLEVIDINEPAYKLYSSLGFVHYDSITRQKLEPEKLSDITAIELPEGYTIQDLKRNKRTNKERYNLDLRTTPEDVQIFSPINKTKYFKPLLIRLIRPIAKVILKIETSKWAFYYEDKLVGTIFVNLGRKEGSPYNLEIMIDPEHSEKIAEPMITHGLEFIQNNANIKQNTLTEFRLLEKPQIAVLNKYNFSKVETMHLLGLKFE